MQVQGEHRPWVVMKFGGTSVATVESWRTISALVRERLEEGVRPLVVCSAIAGVSDSLVRLVAEARAGQPEPVLDALRLRHEQLARELGLDGPALVGSDFESLRRMALGISLTGEASPRLQARILSFGELLLTRLGHAYLRSCKLSVDWRDARELLCVREQPHLRERVAYLSATCDHEVDPVLREQLDALPEAGLLTQGFIARNAAGETVLLGRGGSDTSASYLAVRLAAVRCEIWTDVPGLFSANPHQIPGARLLRALDYDEAQEIATTGARVLHPRCIPPLRRHQIPLHLRCAEHPELEGTVVSSSLSGAPPRVKALSSKSGVILVSMDTTGMWQQVGFLADVFACFKRHGLSIDLVSTSEMNVTVSLDAAANELDPVTLEALLEDLTPYCRARTIGPCAMVSLVGHNIRAILHQLGPVLEVFEEQKIYLVSQAASDLNLSFVVDEPQAERLVRRLHGMLFQLGLTDSIFGVSWRELSGDLEAPPEESRPPWWRVRRAELLPFADHESPLYVYDPDTLNEAASSLLALRSIDRLFYAVKANPNARILELFHHRGLGFECVSPGELELVFALFPALDPRRVLFTPNFAPRDEYRVGLDLGVWVTLDNLHPLAEWPELFEGRELFVRLDPGQGRGHHAHVRTAGSRSKFGVGLSQLDELAALVERSGARVVGFHAHVGSGVKTLESWRSTALQLAEAVEHFPDVRCLDLGGGLSVAEKPGQQELDLGQLDELLLQFKEAHPRFELWLEPGRYLVARAGVLLARVTQIKWKDGVHFVGIDAGMNTLIRPALYGAHHEIVNLTRLDEPKTLIANVVGPICETGDTLGYARPLPLSKEGDRILIATTGAYGRAMSSHYNLREPAAERFLSSLSPPAEYQEGRTN